MIVNYSEKTFLSSELLIGLYPVSAQLILKITSGAVTIDIFLPDVAENLVSDSQCAGEVWQGTVGGAQGQGGEIW